MNARPRWLAWVVASSWLVIALGPFLFMLQTAFKERFELLAGSIFRLPQAPTLANFAAVLRGDLFRFFLNSALVVGASVALVLLIGALAAFAFARLRFRLSRPLFTLVVAGLMVPIHVTLLPIYLLTTRLGLYDSIFALIGPYVAFSLPVTTFILTDHMRGIPREIEDSARLDGCSDVGIFFRIVLPLSRPMLATLGILNAVTLWNEFVFAFALTSSRGSRTLPLAVWDFQGQYASDVPVVMAVLSLATLPLVIAQLVAGKHLVRGLMAGALKG